jgi:hypothetical protein
MNKAILINADDWEGLFINGELKEEGHTLNQGNERIKYFFKLAEQYDFDLKGLQYASVNDDGEEYLDDWGSFPKSLSEFEGKYEIDED